MHDDRSYEVYIVYYEYGTALMILVAVVLAEIRLGLAHFCTCLTHHVSFFILTHNLKQHTTVCIYLSAHTITPTEILEVFMKVYR